MSRCEGDLASNIGLQAVRGPGDFHSAALRGGAAAPAAPSGHSGVRTGQRRGRDRVPATPQSAQAGQEEERRDEGGGQ